MSPMVNLRTRFLHIRSGLHKNPSEISTEEVLYLIKKFNHELSNLIIGRQPGRKGRCPSIQTENTVVGSMDIKALSKL